MGISKTLESSISKITIESNCIKGYTAETILDFGYIIEIDKNKLKNTMLIISDNLIYLTINFLIISPNDNIKSKDINFIINGV